MSKLVNNVTAGLAVAVAVAATPSLWATAWRQLRRLTPDRWWRHWPPRPGPTSVYLEFRRVTQYGGTDRSPTPSDVVDYLRWCREWDRSSG